MLDTVFFEFEGVLADTAAARRQALAWSLADGGLTPSPEDVARCCAGNTLADAAAEALRETTLDDTARELVVLRAERYFGETMAGGISLAPGAGDLVDQLAGRARMAIVSTATRRVIEFALALAGIDGAFECIVASDDVKHPKPAPDGYARAIASLARRRGIGPAATPLALESSAAGIAAARAARLPVIAVGALPAHQALGADGLIASLEDQTIASLGALVLGVEERTR